MGTKEDFLATLRFGFDEAHAEGVITRPVDMIEEISLGGVGYASNSRYSAARAGVDVLMEAYTTQVPDDLEGVLRKIRDQRPDCLAYLGYGYPTILMAPMFRSLGWDPPPIMTRAFPVSYANPERVEAT